LDLAVVDPGLEGADKFIEEPGGVFVLRLDRFDLLAQAVEPEIAVVAQAA